MKPKDSARKNQWVEDHLLGGKPNLPFAFEYAGKASGKLLADWPRKLASQKLDAGRTQHTLVWADAKTGLEVRCVGVDYNDYPAIEWTVFIRNTGSAPTPILDQIQGLDIELQGQGNFLLHHNQGDTCGPNAYEPFVKPLTAGTEARFSPVGGRSRTLICRTAETESSLPWAGRDSGPRVSRRSSRIACG